MKTKKKKEKGQLYFTKMIPTMLSLLALCFCISTIKYAYSGHLMLATSLLLIACFLDGIDGRIARLLNVSSDFGAQIDSLADMVNFGIAPGFILYCWKLSEVEWNLFSWFAVLLLACCMAIRLARFNIDLSTKDWNDPLVKYFFRGMPAPAVAAMSMFPIVLTFRFGYGFWNNPLLIVIYTIILALFAGSTLPTPCFKKVKISEKYKNLVLILVSMYIILLVMDPWLALSVLGILYTISIIISMFLYLNFKKNKK